MSHFLTYGLIALLFLWLGSIRHGDPLSLVSFVFASWFFLGIMVYDFWYWCVPRVPVLIAILFSCVFSMQFSIHAALVSLLGAVLGFLILWCVNILFTGILRITALLKENESAIGFGDPLLLGAIGAIMGVRLLPQIIFFASVQGLLAFGIAKALRVQRFFLRIGNYDAVPFGAFLCLTSLEMLIFSHQVQFLYRL